MCVSEADGGVQLLRNYGTFGVSNMTERQIHPFGPVYGPQSRVLILGSFPSVRSRQEGFYYGHPRNRFWRVVSAVCGAPMPQTVEEKKTLILAGGLALWDVIASCDIKGSADASVKNAAVNDITSLVHDTAVRRIYCNGRLAFELFSRHIGAACGITVSCLPSTSPANAAWSLERLIEAWRVIRLP